MDNRNESEGREPDSAPITIPGTSRIDPGKSAQSRVRRGITLADNLDRTDRHPVLLFGSSKSGKSSLIMSLILELQRTPDIDVELGEPVLDEADPRYREKHELAKKFYDRQAYIFDQGQNLLATQGDPFFIPINIRPKDSLLPAVKLAFLDGRGEAYEPVEDENSGDLYKAFNDDIRAVLQKFSRGLSVIYVAPYIVGSDYDRETSISNVGLLGALRGYREFRQGRRQDDFLLFLLTKWDQFAPPLNSRGLFDRPRASDINRILAERYSRSWGDFQALPLEGPAKERRAFMQYSAGYFIDDQPQTPPPNIASSFSRYPRTVLNWLYGNATKLRVNSTDHSLTLRKILFEEVIDPGEPTVTISERIASLLTSR